MVNQRNKISNRAVTNLAVDCLQKYCDEMGWTSIEDFRPDVIGIYESVIYPEHDISLITDYDLGHDHGQKILGKMISDEKTILIDKSINQQSNDPRFTFTLGHEIGHAVSHMGQSEYFRCTENTIFERNQDQTEFQANLFAENLIMPPALVSYLYEHYYGTKKPFRYIGAGNYCIGSQKTYISSLVYLGWKLAAPLTQYFSNISKQSLAYRMFKLGLIVNTTRESLFDEISSEFRAKIA